MKNEIAAALILTILVMSFAASSNMVNATPASKVATPNINPDGGTYSSTQYISIYCSTIGATIYYTINGLTPSSSSTKYTGTIIVSSSMTIKAIAIKSGWTASNIASETYTLKVATPELNPDGGTCSGTQHVSISCDTNGATIYYTTNGNPPSSSSTKYTSPITVTTTTTIKAIAYKSGWTTSNIASETYTIVLPFKSFTLSATGTAYDRNSHKSVPVTLALTGSASGILQNVVNLNIQGGTLNVGGYGQLTISGGNGYIISSCRYHQFTLIMCDKYGAQVACILLTGTAQIVSDIPAKTILSLDLGSHIVVLPFPSHPTLTDLDLNDQVILTH